MFEVSVKATSTTYLSGSIWPLALNHCALAQAEAARPLGEPIDAEMQHSAGAIILAVTAAEAYINEFLLDPRTPVGEAEIGRSPHDQRFRPTDKWKTTLRHATGDAHVGGRRPLQDFGFLVDLRNSFVHYLPEERVIGLTPGIPVPPATLREQEEARLEQFITGRTQIGARCPNNVFLQRVLCGNAASWAVDVVYACVEELCLATGATVPHWFVR